MPRDLARSVRLAAPSMRLGAFPRSLLIGALAFLTVVDLLAARSPGPDRLRFLVDVLCVRTDAGWRIAALFATDDKSPD